MRIKIKKMIKSKIKSKIRMNSCPTLKKPGSTTKSWKSIEKRSPLKPSPGSAGEDDALHGSQGSEKGGGSEGRRRKISLLFRTQILILILILLLIIFLILIFILLLIFRCFSAQQATTRQRGKEE
jgi:hypothetical protein